MTQTRPRRRPLTHQEKLALQERKQRRREKMEESRELAKGPIDLTFCLLVMLLTDSASIRDVLLFPTMKPIDQ
jgi:cell division protein FtsW